MAKAPRFKVYIDGEYRASVKCLEDAAIIVGAWTHGEVRDGHTKVIWREGFEEFSAGESFDNAAEIMLHRAQMYIEQEEAQRKARQIWPPVNALLS